MSSITLTPAGGLPIVRRQRDVRLSGGRETAVAQTRLRLTTRGRRVLAALVAVPVAGGIAFAVLSGGSALASGEIAPTGSFATVTVLPGDTLWSIATDIAPEADPRDVVSAIARLNLVDAADLAAGDVLSIPSEYASAP